jgi:sugar phosphate isomerase/epimerase
MGTGMITLCTGTRDPRDQWGYHPDNESPSAWVDLLSAMEQALTIAMKHNITLGIEPEKANVISSAFKARNLLDHFQSPHLKIIMDPANLFEHEGPDEVRRIVEEAFALLASDIALAHAKDRTANGNFVAAGQGVLDYAHYIEQLKTINYAGALILHGLTEQEVPACVQFLQERLQSNA